VGEGEYDSHSSCSWRKSDLKVSKCIPKSSAKGKIEIKIKWQERRRSSSLSRCRMENAEKLKMYVETQLRRHKTIDGKLKKKE
jgi:hypothetical protein